MPGEPRTGAGRLLLEILNVQARHVGLPPELTNDFPRRILEIEREAAALPPVAPDGADLDVETLARAIKNHATAHKSHSRTHVRVVCAEPIAGEYKRLRGG